MPNLTKKELTEKKKKIQDRKQKRAKANHKDFPDAFKRANAIAGEPEKDLVLSKPADLETLEKDPWSGLTERQILIQRLKMRGLSQANIASVLKISQSMVHKELKVIKQVHKERGISLDKQATVGGAISLYEEIGYKAWEIYSTAEDNKEKIQALNTVMSAHEKQMKLLTDLGLIEKAAERVNHTHELKRAPLLDNWDTEGRAKLASNIITSQLSELEEPAPPSEDEDIQEAEILDEEDKQ